MDVKHFVPDNYGWYVEKFRPGAYRDAFEDYCRVSAPGFEALESGAVSPEEAVAALLELCGRLIKWPGKALKTYDLKCLFSLYTAPASTRRGSAEALAFAELLNREWNSRYPREQYKSGDFETLAEGFRRKVILGFKIAEED